MDQTMPSFEVEIQVIIGTFLMAHYLFIIGKLLFDFDVLREEVLLLRNLDYYVFILSYISCSKENNCKFWLLPPSFIKKIQNKMFKAVWYNNTVNDDDDDLIQQPYHSLLCVYRAIFTVSVCTSVLTEHIPLMSIS